MWSTPFVLAASNAAINGERSAPSLFDPFCGLDMAKALVATAFQSVGWIHLAVKDHNARVGGRYRLFPVIARPSRNAVVLEAGAPSRRPVIQLALLVQKVRQILLLIAVLGPHFFGVSAEILQNISMCAQLKTVDRGVADNALTKTPKARVVVDDAKFTGQGKELIHAADNNHIKIKEQRLPLESVQITLKGGEFFPSAITLAGSQMNVQVWNGQALDFRANPFGVVGQADKAKISAEMAAHHGVESIDVLWAVLGAPFHAKNVALLLCGLNHE